LEVFLAGLNGIIYILDEYGRGDEIQDAMSYKNSFSDTISSNFKIPSKGLAFVSLNGEDIHYVMLFQKSGRVATKIDRISFKMPVELLPALSLEDVKRDAPTNINRFVIKQTEYGLNRLSPKVFPYIYETIKSKYVDIIEDFNRLERKILGLDRAPFGAGAAIIAYEKDAVSLSLRVAGFSDNDLSNWSSGDEPAPFLRGFDSAVIREDPMVAHDAEVFGEWRIISRFVVGAVEFTKEDQKLTIINVNRHRIEETLGVDLILYHHSYKSYVMVQYKRMVNEGNKLVYRPIGETYESEIDKMNQFTDQIYQYEERVSGAIDSYRLNNDLFYFKLCPAELKDPLSTKMITGMYLPLSYWNKLMQSEDTQGPRGGRIISYENVQRHVNNTLFVELMQNGWIGSSTTASEVISELIRDSISRNNSLILANYTKL
jgi:hypothetical protein